RRRARRARRRRTRAAPGRGGSRPTSWREPRGQEVAGQLPGRGPRQVGRAIEAGTDRLDAGIGLLGEGVGGRPDVVVAAAEETCRQHRREDAPHQYLTQSWSPAARSPASGVTPGVAAISDIVAALLL